MIDDYQDEAHRPIDRRQLLARCGMGLPLLGLAAMEQEASGAETSPLAPRSPHFPATAKHVVHLFMNGGPSHVDTFDPKPELTRQHGKSLPARNLRTERKTAFLPLRKQARLTADLGEVARAGQGQAQGQAFRT